MVDTKAVSVRLPLDLINELNSYATDKGMVRGGDANIGGAIITILREHFGQSDNVKQVSDNVDIDSIVNVAVESRLEAVLNQVESLRLKVHSQETYSLLYTSLKADVDIRFDETNKAIATLSSEAKVSRKKAPDAIPEIEGDSNAEITGEVIEPDALPIIEDVKTIAAPSIENPLPNDGLSDAIAASDDSTVSIKLPVKEVVAIVTVETLNDETGMNTNEAFAIAQQRGYKNNAKSFRDRFDKQDMAKDFGLRRIPHDGGREKWLYFDARSETQS